MLRNQGLLHVYADVATRAFMEAWATMGWLAAALSLAGVPPFSGFVSKLALLKAGIAEKQFVIVAVSLVVSLLTLFAMARIWTSAFWSRAEIPAPERLVSATGRRKSRSPLGMLIPTGALVAVSLTIAVAATPIYAFCQRAAGDLLDRGAYTEQVLEP